MSDAAQPSLSSSQRLVVAGVLQELAGRGLIRPPAQITGPQTDEELLEAVEQLTGKRLPRVAVCEGHTAPATTFCDLYFNRVSNLLQIGSRGGGKSATSAILHGAKNRWNPGYSSAVAGAIAKQGQRLYTEFQRFCRDISDEIVDSLLSKTEWVNGSFTEVLTATVKGMNSPHPRFSQFDEVELTTSEIFEEYLNMAQGNDIYPAQQLLTSTRKYAYGIVQDIVNQHDAAVRQGQEPPWRVDTFCVYEVLRNQPHCRSAPENSGRPESELCNCHQFVKGEWDDGSPRRFDQVCGGRAFRSDGFQPLVDAQTRFRQLSRSTWEAQQECLHPDVEGLVHKWVRPRHRLARWMPFPAFGPVYRGWDWGGQAPNAVVWLQHLSQAVALDADGQVLLTDDDDIEPAYVIPQHAVVQFDEVYRTADELPGDGGWSDLGMFVARRECQWRQIPAFAEMHIAGDVCDPAGMVAKREVRKGFRAVLESGECPDVHVPDFKSRPVRVAESVRFCISMGESDRLYYVPSMCPGIDAEYSAYRWPDKRTNRNESEEPLKQHDHANDALRYCLMYIESMTNRAVGGVPGAVERELPLAAPTPVIAAANVARGRRQVGTLGSPSVRSYSTRSGLR